MRLACAEFREYPTENRRARFLLIDSAGRVAEAADCEPESEAGR